MLSALERLLAPGAFRMGLHVRMGNNWFDQSDAAEGARSQDDRRELALHAARCALALLVALLGALLGALLVALLLATRR
jgi:hypothetical protein